MYCENCGAWLSANETECDECGAVVEKKKAVTNTESENDLTPATDLYEDPYKSFNTPPISPKSSSIKTTPQNNPQKPKKIKEQNKKQTGFNDFESSDFSFADSFFDQDISNNDINEKEPELKTEDIVENGLDEEYSKEEKSVGTFDFSELLTDEVEENKTKNIDANTDENNLTQPSSANSSSDLSDSFLGNSLFSSDDEITQPELKTSEGVSDADSLLSSTTTSDLQNEQEDDMTSLLPPSEEKKKGKKTKEKNRTEKVPKIQKQTKQKKIKSGKSNKNIPILIVGAVLVVGVIVGISALRKDKPENPSSTNPSGFSTSTIAPEMSTFEDDYTLTGAPELLPKASVYAIKQEQLAKVPDAKYYGKIITTDVFQGIVTLETDKGYVIAFSSDFTGFKDYIGKGISVEGTVFLQNVTADKVYIYDVVVEPTEPESTTMPTSVPSTMPSENLTDKPMENTSGLGGVEAPGLSSPLEGTTDPIIPEVPVNSTTESTAVKKVHYISATEAEQLKVKWSKDPTLLASKNAYFVTVKTSDYNNKNQFVIISTNNTFTINFMVDKSDFVPGTKLIITGSPSASGVTVSEVYIIK